LAVPGSTITLGPLGGTVAHADSSTAAAIADTVRVGDMVSLLQG